MNVKNRCLTIQAGAVLGFLSARALPESSGAFFGIDWLILAIVLLALQLVHYAEPQEKQLS